MLRSFGCWGSHGRQASRQSPLICVGRLPAPPLLRDCFACDTKKAAQDALTHGDCQIGEDSIASQAHTDARRCSVSTAFPSLFGFHGDEPVHRSETNAMCHYRKRTGSPAGKRPPERRAPKRQAIAWPRVTEFGPRTASPVLDAALRLAAQEHHEIRAFAGLGTQRLVRDDQGRSRRNLCDAI